MKKINKIFITSTLSLIGAGAILLGAMLSIQAKPAIPTKQIANITNIIEAIDTTSSTNDIEPTVVENTSEIQTTFNCPQGHENCDGQHITQCTQNHEFCDRNHAHARGNQSTGTPKQNGSGIQHANGGHHGNRR